MIKKLNVSQLIDSNLFVSEPVSVTNDRINEGEKVILTGGRGCGKSVVLARREKEGVLSKKPAVLTKFTSSSTFDKRFRDTSFMEHYYELVMSTRFLSYIRNNYPDVYKERFEDLEELAKRKLTEAIELMRSDRAQFCKMNKLFAGEILSEVVSRFRNEVRPDSMELLIDNFDWTNSSDPRVQNILKKYFSMFERVVVTSDDKDVVSGRARRELFSRGYSVIPVSYASYCDNVRNIAEAHGLGSVKDELDDSDYRNLIIKTGGNLDIMLASLCDMEAVLKHDEGRRDAGELLDRCATIKTGQYKRLTKKINAPKLYL